MSDTDQPEVTEEALGQDPTAADSAADAPADAVAGGPAAPAADETTMSDEAIVALIAERDDYLEKLQRERAEFANARRRADEQAALQRQQAAADLVNRLLPVLDSAQAALDQGIEDVRPLNDSLLEILVGQGLAPMDPVGEPFDPQKHEAVMFESGDDGEQVVVETMRLGYLWNDRVLRAAMVKVRG
ncbi:MAG: nucleotide exchange factor GrpE [Actinomycetota bacterium]